MSNSLNETEISIPLTQTVECGKLRRRRRRS